MYLSCRVFLDLLEAQGIKDLMYVSHHKPKYSARYISPLRADCCYNKSL